MLGRTIKLMLAPVWLGFASGAIAQEPEVIVGEIGFPNHVWGVQDLPFDVTNNTDWLKFLIVETDVGFEGSYVTPHRVVRTNFALEPSGVTKIVPKIEVPPNFGQMMLWVRIYDVVDTLDDIGLGTKVFEQPFKVKFRMPDEIYPYFQERITLPPLVGYHGLFDNELVRLMAVMVSEGKTLPEIASLCGADTAYVRSVATQMDAARYLKKGGDSCWSQLPVVTTDEAKAGRELAERFSDTLGVLLTRNLARRQEVMDSLKATGVFSGDSTKFLEGGTILYHPYPLVAGLYLWQVLGQKFIIGSRNLEIFQKNDYCEPEIGAYMYVVRGGDYFNGHHFYSATALHSGYQSQFGDSIPVITCKPGFERKAQLMENVDWNYPRGYTPESFLYDSTVVNPLLRVLDQDVTPVLQSTIMELRQISRQFRQSDLPMGVRYWFWNLAASLTLEKMVASGALTRSGNGQYKFMEYKDKSYLKQ